MAEQNLYERIGGVNAIAMVVDRFGNEIVKNPKLNVDPALKEWNKYTGKDMREAHEDLHITSEEFDEVGAEISRALDHFKMPEREKQEVLAAIASKKAEVVNPSS